MKTTLMYRLSLGLTVLLSLAAVVMLLGWLGSFIKGVGQLPALALIPWWPLGLIALAGINCTLRVRLIGRAGQFLMAG